MRRDRKVSAEWAGGSRRVVVAKEEGVQWPSDDSLFHGTGIRS